jgi:hypothetical protein
MTTTQIDSQIGEFTDQFQLVKDEIGKVIVGNDVFQVSGRPRLSPRSRTSCI